MTGGGKGSSDWLDVAGGALVGADGGVSRRVGFVSRRANVAEQEMRGLSGDMPKSSDVAWRGRAASDSLTVRRAQGMLGACADVGERMAQRRNTQVDARSEQMSAAVRVLRRAEEEGVQTFSSLDGQGLTATQVASVWSGQLASAQAEADQAARRSLGVPGGGATAGGGSGAGTGSGTGAGVGGSDGSDEG
jgi:hypothetical protein